MRVLITGGSGFIGTNLSEFALKNGWEILNVDIAKPKVDSLKSYWEKCDIMDAPNLEEVFLRFQPSAVVHLAAETDTDPSMKLEDYGVNTVGTRHVISCIQRCRSVKHAIFTSTQFVHQAKVVPQHDEDYMPHTIYGHSKVINEMDIRRSELDCSWTIIRPTNIWGPWHLRYPYEFWKVLSRGLYIHPGRQPVLRSYGYVGNVVWQIGKILLAEPDLIHRQVFYVGDRPIDLYRWVNGFSLQQTGKSVLIFPRASIRLLARIGDVLKKINIHFPITTSRYKSMTESNPAPMEKTFLTFGTPPSTIEHGIEITVNWMKIHHPHLVHKRK